MTKARGSDPARGDVMSAVGALGPFFAVDTHPADAVVPSPWRSMGELVHSPNALLNRIGAVRAVLAATVAQPPDAVELRVAASVTHLGLVARLIAPSLAVAVLSGRVLDTDLDQAWWQDELGGGFPLCLPELCLPELALEIADGASGGPERLAGRVGDQLIDGTVRDLTRAVIAVVPISGHVLWGNAASALNSAASIIGTHQPQRIGRAASLARSLLARMPLAGQDLTVGSGFRRRSCCLIYRVAPPTAGTRLNMAALCGDCVLARSQQSQQS